MILLKKINFLVLNVTINHLQKLYIILKTLPQFKMKIILLLMINIVIQTYNQNVIINIGMLIMDI
jgi:hypothetical protein